jgi:hypothetical protein
MNMQVTKIEKGDVILTPGNMSDYEHCTVESVYFDYEAGGSHNVRLTMFKRDKIQFYINLNHYDEVTVVHRAKDWMQELPAHIGKALHDYGFRSKADVKLAIEHGSLAPGKGAKPYGLRSHLIVCKWVGVIIPKRIEDVQPDLLRIAREGGVELRMAKALHAAGWTKDDVYRELMRLPGASEIDAIRIRDWLDDGHCNVTDTHWYRTLDTFTLKSNE